MAKEWILNSAMNRYQLNFKRNVGGNKKIIANPEVIEEISSEIQRLKSL